MTDVKRHAHFGAKKSYSITASASLLGLPKRVKAKHLRGFHVD